MADELDAELQQRLVSHSAYFNSLVRLVPAKFYLPDDDEVKHGKFYKNRKKPAPIKQLIKDASKKAKKRRLDPNHAKSVLDLQQQEVVGKDKSDSEDETNAREEEFSVEKVPSGKIGDLRARLQERIQTLQGKRKASSSSKKHSERPKKKAKSEIKTEKKKLNEVSQSKKDKKNEVASQSARDKVVNVKGEVVFSKFDFMEKNKTSIHGRDYKKLLASAENRMQKLEELKVKDADKAREIVEKEAWKSAFDKAEGVKVKDDPKLLKKSMKRKEKQKTKSKKQWNERKEQQQKHMDDRQKTRQKHLKERVESKKKKSAKGFKKHRPGF